MCDINRECFYSAFSANYKNGLTDPNPHGACVSRVQPPRRRTGGLLRSQTSKKYLQKNSTRVSQMLKKNDDAMLLRK